LVAELTDGGGECILAKERIGCLSLWDASKWESKLADGIALVGDKIRAGRLEARLEEVQLLGRLLSTRHSRIKLAGRGRLVIPEGFREFLGVERGGSVIVIGAAVCIELWNPERWQQHIEQQMPEFRRLLDQLVG
jgi:MraZ protein